MRRIGFPLEFINQTLHGGGFSTCPPKYSVSSGSNGIVSTALSGNQILANNLNGDYINNVYVLTSYLCQLYNHSNQPFDEVNYSSYPIVWLLNKSFLSFASNDHYIHSMVESYINYYQLHWITLRSIIDKSM